MVSEVLVSLAYNLVSLVSSSIIAAASSSMKCMHTSFLLSTWLTRLSHAGDCVWGGGGGGGGGGHEVVRG